ncbi:HmuY family protein [Prevotella sp. E13-17]|uniref:HmuY family protein n=1 Tax=Prevotella sp. E13-17 TaxID=2913616 RepID=UPI001EDA775D|nr:HmuY family protein [Prevotella sp. E13-17]UKK50820.1 HmuY family protein [Prevotella sp. E13-17]
MNRHLLLSMLGIVAVMGLFSACDMMGDLYDDTITGGDDRQDVPVVEQREGQYYIDATSYTKWVYINMHGDSLAITVADISTEDHTESGAPEEWDYAHHRYDVKTNDGSVMMTDCHSIEQLEAMGLPAEATWTNDEYSEQSITVDMSHMLEGYLDYAPGFKNREAGRWLDVDTSSMPPIYTMHDNVMLFRFKDGTYAAVQLVNYMSTDRYQTKGWMTVNYKYPIFTNQ